MTPTQQLLQERITGAQNRGDTVEVMRLGRLLAASKNPPDKSHADGITTQAEAEAAYGEIVRVLNPTPKGVNLLQRLLGRS